MTTDVLLGPEQGLLQVKPYLQYPLSRLKRFYCFGQYIQIADFRFSSIQNVFILIPRIFLTYYR